LGDFGIVGPAAIQASIDAIVALIFRGAPEPTR